MRGEEKMPIMARMQPIILPYLSFAPEIHETAFIAPGAAVIGDVAIAPFASVWFGAVLRGDDGKIVVGENSNIQDGSVMHEGANVGKNVTVGHSAVIHKATVRDNALIGARAVVWDDAVVEEFAMVGVGAVLKPGMIVPSKTLVLGVPAKVIRELTEPEVQMIQASAAIYKDLAKRYKERLVEFKKNQGGQHGCSENQ